MARAKGGGVSGASPLDTRAVLRSAGLLFGMVAALLALWLLSGRADAAETAVAEETAVNAETSPSVDTGTSADASTSEETTASPDTTTSSEETSIDESSVDLQSEVTEPTSTEDTQAVTGETTVESSSSAPVQPSEPSALTTTSATPTTPVAASSTVPIAPSPSAPTAPAVVQTAPDPALAAPEPVLADIAATPKPNVVAPKLTTSVPTPKIEVAIGATSASRETSTAPQSPVIGVPCALSSSALVTSGILVLPTSTSDACTLAPEVAPAARAEPHTLAVEATDTSAARSLRGTSPSSAGVGRARQSGISATDPVTQVPSSSGTTPSPPSPAPTPGPRDWPFPGHPLSLLSPHGEGAGAGTGGHDNAVGALLVAIAACALIIPLLNSSRRPRGLMLLRLPKIAVAPELRPG